MRRTRLVMRPSMSSSSSLTVPSAYALRGRRHRLAEVLLVRERRAAPVLRELAQHAELVVAEVLVGKHHDGEQLERRHVLSVGGGVDGDAFVELLESPRLVHHPER